MVGTIGFEPSHPFGLAVESGWQSIIYTYDQPKLGSLGNPVSMTQLTTSGGGFNLFLFRSKVGPQAVQSRGRTTERLSPSALEEP
jgi:hypothetical protein